MSRATARCRCLRHPLTYPARFVALTRAPFPQRKGLWSLPTHPFILEILLIPFNTPLDHQEGRLCKSLELAGCLGCRAGFKPAAPTGRRWQLFARCLNHDFGRCGRCSVQRDRRDGDYAPRLRKSGAAISRSVTTLESLRRDRIASH